MEFKESFIAFDDTGDNDDITLYKKDILFIDDNVCLVSTIIDKEMKYFLFKIDTLEVLTKEYQFWYIKTK